MEGSGTEREGGRSKTTAAEEGAQASSSYTLASWDPGLHWPQGSVNESFSAHFEHCIENIHWPKDRPGPVTCQWSQL